MQITLKQAEITAAIAGYLQNVLGVSGVSPETLSVVYKQGRSDKNGMTAELEIEAPRYEKAGTQKTSGEVGTVAVIIEGLSDALAATTLGNGLLNGFGATPTETISVSDVQAPGAAPAEAVVEPVATVKLEDPANAPLTPELADPGYDGERRAEVREETANRAERVAELNDEVAKALAEDEAAEQAEAGTPLAEDTGTQPATAAPLFG